MQGTTTLHPFSFTAPFIEGVRHLQESLFWGLKEEQKPPSLSTRTIHLFVGASLLIPLINCIVFKALQFLYPISIPSPVSLGDRSTPFPWWNFCERDPQANAWAEKIQKEMCKVKDLLRYGASKAADPQKELVKGLFQEGVEKGYHQKKFRTFAGTTIFQTLAKSGQADLITELLSNRSDVDLFERDVQQNCDNTPLIWAIANAANSSAVAILEHVEAGDCRLNIQDSRYQNSALHLAIGKGYRERSFHGDSLEYSNIIIVQMLLEKGADLNLQNKEGNTPLHLACMRRDAEAINLLLKNGAQADIQNKEGLTPKELLSWDYMETYEVLKETVAVFFSQ